MAWVLRLLLVILSLPAAPEAQSPPVTSWNINELGSSAKDLSQAELPALRSRAEAGEARAQFLLGLAYEYGYAGLTKDVAEALRWNTRAAEQGIGLAETWVGDFYYDGIGVPIDYAAALGWYRRGSEHGYAPASRYVGDFHLFGLGTDRSPEQAIEWYSRAATQGDRRGAARHALLTPPCEDEFCHAVRTLIISRDNGFKDLKGPRRIEPFKEVFAGTFTPAGAETCTITPANSTEEKGAQYECIFPDSWGELADKLRTALPIGWISEVQDLALLYAGPDDQDLAVILSGAGLKILAPFRR
jgi:Sel1 repeat